MKLLSICSIVVLTTCLAPVAPAAPLRNYPQKLTQPDGSVVNCFASGDEFNHWLHDKDNYTIVQHPQTGYFVYAVLKGSELAPSDYVVGKVDPKSVGLVKGVHPSSVVMTERRKAIIALSGGARPKAPGGGVLNNLVIFVRFADEAQSVFPDTPSLYDSMYNANVTGANSMYNYYEEVSYGHLLISSTFYPVSSSNVLSYQDIYTRPYFRSYNAVTNPIGYSSEYDAVSREQAMLKRAIEAVATQIPPGLNIDTNDDGYVDNVSFIFSGDAEGWSEWTLWPHSGLLVLQSASINGALVKTYDIQLRGFLLQEMRGVNTLCHEMFHVLGAPDLYNYGKHAQPDELFPVWIWDIMGAKNYPNPVVNPPVHMSAYMKYKYGAWITSMPTISPGTYTLAPLQSPTGNCFKVLSPYSSSEYFVLEYRKRAGTFESSLPGEGLLVYRINSSLEGNGNGPPDEVYVFRPGGTTTMNGMPDSAGFSANAGRRELTDFTPTPGFLSDGSLGGLNLISVGPLGDSLSFTLGPRLAAVPHVVDYGNVMVGGTSDTVSIRFTNPDNASVSVVSIVHSSANFILESPLLPIAIPPAGSCTIKAVFRPSGEGLFNDTIVVRGDDTIHPLAGAILTGQGAVASPGQFVWSKDTRNPVLSGGAIGAWNRELLCGSVLYNSDSSRYEMWFGASSGASSDWAPMYVGFASSKDGIGWTMHPTPVFTPTNQTWDAYTVEAPWVIRENGQYKMWYSSYLSYSPFLGYVGYATSSDGILWTKHPGAVLGPGTAAWENDGPYTCTVMPYSGGYQMWYGAFPLASGGPSIGYATSTDGITWQRDTGHNPVLTSGAAGQWDAGSVLWPRVYQFGNIYYMWYEGREARGSTLTYHRLTGVATSTDMGVTWTKSADNPVLSPSAGTWDATRAVVGSVVQNGSTFEMWYTGGDASNLVRIGHATAISTGGVEGENIPKAFVLAQNYPNPFNPRTTITFQLPRSTMVMLSVFDILGRVVATPVNEEKAPGTHAVTFDARGLASGVYVYRLVAGQYVESRKMVLMK